MLIESDNIEPPVEDLIEEFKYKIKPTQVHKQLLTAIEGYYRENEKFMTKENMAAGRRARKHLMLIWHLVRQRRAEISAEYNGGQDDAT